MTKILYIPNGEYLIFQTEDYAYLTVNFEESCFFKYPIKTAIRKICIPTETSEYFRERNNLGTRRLVPEEFEVITDD